MKVEQLKRELLALELPTTRTKAELQKRFREALESRGINVEEREFQCEPTPSVENREEATGTTTINDNIIAILMQAISITKEKEELTRKQQDELSTKFQNLSKCGM